MFIKFQTILNRYLTMMFFIIGSSITTQAQDEETQFFVGQFAPEFQVRDIYGNTHSLAQYKGKKILLSFNRNAGCAVGNYRLHELEDERKYFEEKGIILISVFESSIENLKLLADTNIYYQFIVSDIEGILYRKYGVEINKRKVAKGAHHGAKNKAEKGKKLFPTTIKPDGNPERMTADFLLDENGNILIAYYSKYLGDRLPIELIKKTFE